MRLKPFKLKFFTLLTAIIPMMPSALGVMSPNLLMQISNIYAVKIAQKGHSSMVTLIGVVLKKPSTMTEEAWRAGGGEYYVLDVGNSPVQERSATEGVILRPSSAVTLDSFEEYVGKQVQVQGEYLPLETYVPQSPVESYPTDLYGRPLPRGGGFQVMSIDLINN